jgi:hypothetical protein
MPSINDYLSDYSTPSAPPMFSQGQNPMDPLGFLPQYSRPSVPNPVLPQAQPADMAFDANAGGGAGTMWDRFKELMGGAIGTKDAPGWGNLAVGGASALMNGWLGMQNYGLAKKTLEQAKQQFDLNYNASKTTTNANMADRQRARVASNPGAYQSVGDYMAQNGIK